MRMGVPNTNAGKLVALHPPSVWTQEKSAAELEPTPMDSPAAPLSVRIVRLSKSPGATMLM